MAVLLQSLKFCTHLKISKNEKVYRNSGHIVEKQYDFKISFRFIF